jgi:uncharacterized protein YbjT (DUF2867 family)
LQKIWRAAESAGFPKRPSGEERKMILITGASGTVGRAVLAEVVRSGEKHRAMYRSKKDAANAPEGTEAVIADFSDKASLAAALRGVESVYLVFSDSGAGATRRERN